MVYDHNSNEGEAHFEYLPPNQFNEETKEINNMGHPINPVPRSVVYGGSLREEMIPPGSRGVKNFQNPSPNRRDLPPKSSPQGLSVEGQNASDSEARRYVPVRSPTLRENTANDHQQNSVQSPPQSNVTNNEDQPSGQVLTYYWRQGQGFKSEYNGVTSFPHETIISTLENLTQLVKPYNDNLSSLFLNSMLVVISFFLLFLQMFILRMSSEWRTEAWGLVVLFILISFIVFQVIIFLKRRKASKDGEAIVFEFVSQENSRFYEQKNASLTANLNVVQIEIR